MSVSVVVPILRPNDAELRRFAAAMFRYADDAGFVSFRVFPQAKPGQAPPKPPPGGFEFMAAQIKDGFDHMVTTAAAVCLHAVNPDYPGVFCPPICTFQDREGAKESDILNGVALSVELDTGNPYIARAKLEALLGPVTVALQSGGTWADPATGEIFPRVHLHWRLNEPTRCPDDHGRLRLARKLAAQLVNADMTAVPISHPLRWPGSWNLKGAPVMATICAYNYTAEIDLGTALERLGDAIEAAGMLLDTSPHTPGDLLTTQNFARLRAATLAIPNKTQDWWGFNRMGMALYAATNGDLAGRDIYAEWSATSAKHVEDAVNERWANYAKSPPTRIGAGTIFYEAKTHGWRDAPISVGLAMDERPEPPEMPEPDMSEFIGQPPGAPGHRPEPPAFWEFDNWAPEDMPQRAWHAAGFLMRGALTVVSGAGGSGKSSLMIGWCIALSLGLPYGRLRPKRPLRVVYYNVEDDQDEQKRRLAAAARQFNTPCADIMRNLRIIGPLQVGTLFNTTPDANRIINTPLMAQITEYAENWQTDVLIVDPLVELHTVDENDNTAMRQILAHMRTLAQKMNISLALVHHARKGGTTPGDPDTLRGASAIVGAARIVLTVNTMAKEDAGALGIKEERRRDYFRVDDGKLNYARMTEADWFEKVEHTLPNGDAVAAAHPWKPPSAFQNATVASVNEVLDLIEAGYEPDVPFSPRESGLNNTRWVGHIVCKKMDITPEQARIVVGTWFKNGVLEEFEYRDPVQRKPRRGVKVIAAKRPGTCL